LRANRPVRSVVFFVEVAARERSGGLGSGGRRFRFRYVLAAAVSALVLFFPSSASALTTAHVSVVSYAFNPDTQDIAVGDSVEWDWNSGATHHTTTSYASSTEVWDSGQLSGTSTYTHHFPTAGEF